MFECGDRDNLPIGPLELAAHLPRFDAQGPERNPVPPHPGLDVPAWDLVQPDGGISGIRSIFINQRWGDYSVGCFFCGQPGNPNHTVAERITILAGFWWTLRLSYWMFSRADNCVIEC